MEKLSSNQFINILDFTEFFAKFLKEREFCRNFHTTVKSILYTILEIESGNIERHIPIQISNHIAQKLNYLAL